MKVGMDTEKLNEVWRRRGYPGGKDRTERNLAAMDRTAQRTNAAAAAVGEPMAQVFIDHCPADEPRRAEDVFQMFAFEVGGKRGEILYSGHPFTDAHEASPNDVLFLAVCWPFWPVPDAINRAYEQVIAPEIARLFKASGAVDVVNIGAES